MAEAADRAVVLCRDLCKTYGQGEGQVVALRGVNPTIGRGELRLLMGPSGSGKTTLISIIAGILTQDAGECLVDGLNINHLPDKQKTLYRGQNIGFVFQAFNLIPMLTTEENIALPLLIHGSERTAALAKGKALLREFEMADKIGAYPYQLSGGQQQRIAIARALVHNPKLIVCDEPTSYLDHHTGLMIMQLLRAMVNDKGQTLIVVTHDPRIVDFADKIDRLEDGRIVAG